MNNKTGKKKIQKPPLGLDEQERQLWDLPEWREIFKKKKSVTSKRIFYEFIRVVIIAVMLGVLFTLLNYYLPIRITVTNDALNNIATTIVGASAAILAIIIAFLTFWYGNAIVGIQKSKNEIKDLTTKMSAVVDKIRPYRSGPKEGINGRTKEDLVALASETEKFIEAMQILGNRFERASPGTYYDGVEIYKLDALIKHTGGNWYKAFRMVFKDWESADLSMRIWQESMGLARRIDQANIEIMRGVAQLREILEFVPTLMSILFVFCLALVTLIVVDSNTLILEASTFAAILLVAMLPASAIKLTILFWQLISTRYAVFETQRETDLKSSAFIERNYSPDYEDALLSDYKAMLDAWSEKH